MKHIYVFLISLFIGSFGFGQTTATYSFSGGVTGLNQPAPGITVDPNIGFGSFKNSGTSNPALNSGQLRLYQNSSKGGSIIIYANNGATITNVVVNASGTTGPAGYTVDNGTAVNLNASTTYTISNISGTSEVEFYQRSSSSSNRIYVDSFEVTYTMPATCTAPTTQASLYNTTALGTTTATLNWTPGNGDEVLVLVKEGSAVDSDPEIGTTYTGNTVFTSGDQIGTGNFVVQSGSATSSISITGLSEATTYHVAVYEYNTIDKCYELTELTGSFTTECSTPSEVNTFTATAGNEEVDLTWSNGSCYDEVLIIAKETSAVTVTPTGDGSAYTANATFGSSADLGTSEYAVYKGIGTSVTVTGLTNGNTYHFSVFTRKATSWSAAVADDATLDCTAPAIQASAFTTLLPTATGVSIEFTRGDGDKVLVLMKEGSAVDEDPTSGTSYTANSIFGDLNADELGTGNFAVYNGIEGSNPGVGGDPIDFNVSGLSQGTTYHLAVYEYNDINTCYNLVEMTGNFTTSCDAITTFPFTEGFESGVPPTCWTSFRGTNGLGTGQDWTIDSDSYSGSNAAYVRYENVSGGLAEDWLVTPALDLSSITNTELSFYSKDGISTDYGGEYTVRVSTSSQSNHASFTTVGTYTETELGITYNEKTVDLSAYDGQTIYIAFVMTNDDGDSWFLDDVEVAAGVAPNDLDTEVYDPTSQVAATTITAASSTTSGTAFDAFGFEVDDQGTTDGEPTNITTMRFVPGPSNTADWTDHIQGVTLLDGNVVSYTPTTSITDTEIVLTFGSPIVVADNSSLEFLLGLYLNTTSIIDGSVIQLQIDEASSGFAADASGSDFVDPFLFGDVVGNNLTIDVDATELVFSQQPSDTELNAVMTPSATVSGVDANGNLDTDYNLDVDITSTGTLTGSPVTATAVSGIATFSTLTHTIVGSGLVLTADDGALSTIDSSPFEITEPVVGAADLFFSEYVEGDTGNNKYLEIYNGTGTTITLTDYSVEMYSNGSSSASQTEDFTVGFPTTLDSGDVIVLQAENTSQFTGTAYNSRVCFFNGNDTVVLKKNGIIIDIIGNIGCDPGSAFTASGGFSTANQTLVRNTDVCEGVSIDPSGCGSTSFTTLATEWINLGTDVFSNLGSHTAMCGLPTTYTYNGTWSPSDPNGAATASDDIVITSGDATIDTNTTANSVTVNAGAGLTVDTGIALTTTNGLALESVSDSYSSLILDGTVAGAVSYQRHINNAADSGAGTGSNDLVSPPLSGQTFSDFRDANENILSGEIDNISPGTTFYLFSPFNTALNEYTYYSESDDSETLDAGNGYRTGSTSPGDQDTYLFSGTVETSVVTKSIIAPAASNWNLIGNPYPSYLKIEDFLLDNIAQFDFSSSGIYGYDGLASDGWDIWNLARAQDPSNDGVLIAPGQGFFVASKSGGGAVTFDPNHRSTGTTDDFISGRSTNSITNLELTLNNSSASFITDIYFTASATQSLDPGYDSSLFKSQINDFSLYSHLVMDNTNVPLAIQSLGETDYTDVTIPLGVHALQGEQLTFSISASTLPSTVSVYLEDNVANTSTLLNTNDYVLTPSTALSGIGRFYLRVSNSTLSTVDHNLDQLSIYTNKADKTVVIAGQLLEPTTASVYDVQGRLVSTTQLQTTVRSQAIDVSNLSLGIYVVKLHNAAQNKTQKVIIR